MSESDLLRRLRADAEAIFKYSLKAVAPEEAVSRLCRREGDRLTAGDRTYDLGAIDRIVVVGAGKAAAAMALALEKLLGDRISEGLVSVKYGHGLHLSRIRVIEAGHPLPDANGVEAASRILAMVSRAGARDLVVVLLSGGGSALLPLPAEGLSLEEKQTATDLLIAHGATIHEINAIRKHISALKGGRLAQAAAPAETMTLILSDVVGDDLDVIASGPTVPDTSTFAQCLRIVARCGLEGRMPPQIMRRLQEGAAGHAAETPKPGSFDWRHVYNLIVGSNLQALQAAAAEAARRGYNTVILSARIEGETRAAADFHAAIAREVLASGNPAAPPACLLSGGETTVTLTGGGKGGRNQEFALEAAIKLDGARNIVLLSAGTDGTDGPTDAAGALVDHTTLSRAVRFSLDSHAYLKDNNAYPYFKSLGDLLITGPTRTNVMDMRVILAVRP